MEYLKLVKLLYLSDRESWLRFNRPITGDRYFAMKLGPVLSRTLDLINEDAPDAGAEATSPWQSAIERTRFVVRLRTSDPDVGPLSEAEIDILKEVHDLYQKIDRWKLCDLTHLLPEWSDPGKGRTPILPEKILEFLDKSPEEIEEARKIADEERYLERILGFA